MATFRRLSRPMPLLLGVLLLSISLYAIHTAHADFILMNVNASCGGSRGLTANPNTHLVYVATTSNCGQPGAFVGVIDGQTYSVQRFPIGASGVDPFDAVVNPTTNHVFITSASTNLLVVFDANINQVIRTISMQNRPSQMAVNPLTNKFYIQEYNACTTCSEIGTVDVVDDNTYVVESRIVTPCASDAISHCVSEGIDVDTTTNTIYAAFTGGTVGASTSTIYIINGLTNTISLTTISYQGGIPSGAGEPGFLIAADSVNNMIYAGEPSTGGTVVPAILVISAITNTVVTSIPLISLPQNSPPMPVGVGVNTATDEIYVTMTSLNLVLIADGTTNSFNGTPSTSLATAANGLNGFSPYVVGADPRPISGTFGLQPNGQVYVSNSNGVIVIISQPSISLATTSSSVSCTPNPVAVSQATQCTVTVRDTSVNPTTPSGSVTFSSSGSGSFSPSNMCTLSSTSSSTSICSVQYTPSSGSEGTQTITANYGGDTTHQKSSGSTGLIVTQRATSTSVSCTITSKLVDHKTASCTATVSDTSPGTPITPTGSVSWTCTPTSECGSFSATSCKLSATSTVGTATCSVVYTTVPGKATAVVITATYGGDTDHLGSSGSTTLS